MNVCITNHSSIKSLATLLQETPFLQFPIIFCSSFSSEISSRITCSLHISIRSSLQCFFFLCLYHTHLQYLLTAPLWKILICIILNFKNLLDFTLWQIASMMVCICYRALHYYNLEPTTKLPKQIKLPQNGEHE